MWSAAPRSPRSRMRSHSYDARRPLLTCEPARAARWLILAPIRTGVSPPAVSSPTEPPPSMGMGEGAVRRQLRASPQGDGSARVGAPPPGRGDRAGRRSTDTPWSASITYPAKTFESDFGDLRLVTAHRVIASGGSVSSSPLRSCDAVRGIGAAAPSLRYPRVSFVRFPQGAPPMLRDICTDTWVTAPRVVVSDADRSRPSRKPPSLGTGGTAVQHRAHAVGLASGLVEVHNSKCGYRSYTLTRPLVVFGACHQLRRIPARYGSALTHADIGI